MLEGAAVAEYSAAGWRSGFDAPGPCAMVSDQRSAKRARSRRQVGRRRSFGQSWSGGSAPLRSPRWRRGDEPKWPRSPDRKAKNGNSSATTRASPRVPGLAWLAAGRSQRPFAIGRERPLKRCGVRSSPAAFGLARSAFMPVRQPDQAICDSRAPTCRARSWPQRLTQAGSSSTAGVCGPFASA